MNGLHSAEQNRIIRNIKDGRADLITSVNWYDSELLMIAVSSEHLGVVKKLLELGVDPNIKWKSGYPLHLAVYKGLEYVQALVEYGADVDVTEDRGGETPLHIASRLGKRKTILYLLDNNADKWIKSDNDEHTVDVANSEYTRRIIEEHQYYEPDIKEPGVE
jgi:ankyrin repeat protein